MKLARWQMGQSLPGLRPSSLNGVQVQIQIGIGVIRIPIGTRQINGSQGRVLHNPLARPYPSNYTLNSFPTQTTYMFDKLTGIYRVCHRLRDE